MKRKASLLFFVAVNVSVFSSLTMMPWEVVIGSEPVGVECQTYDPACQPPKVDSAPAIEDTRVRPVPFLPARAPSTIPAPSVITDSPSD